jgi:uncharacterized membrane protein YfhO
VIFLGKLLNPFEQKMFEFHDDTQAGRIQEFTLNLKHGQIPPRMAPNFSKGLTYPVFNFYAPFSYWLSSLLNLTFFSSVVLAMKASFLLALILSFILIWLFLSESLTFYPRFPRIKISLAIQGLVT